MFINGGLPERAHILSHAAGGSNEPNNLLLLCSVCHREQPDGAPRDAQLKWLSSREPWAARTHRALVGVFGDIANEDLAECGPVVQAGVERLRRGECPCGQEHVASARASNATATAMWCMRSLLVQAIEQADGGAE